jgi:hypothetical protein
MADQEPPKAEEPKLVTPEEFITRWPLYTIAPVNGFYPPSRFNLHCDNPKCQMQATTTWMVQLDTQYVSLGSDGDFKWVWYQCGSCTKNYLVVMYKELQFENRSKAGTTRRITTRIQKIGQYPALSVDIPKGIENNLGPDGISLYKKGLVNRNAGYGLGAVTYIRRVVEDKTNELIEVAAKLAESHNVEAKVVEQIRRAATERTTYDQKLKIAATVLPSSLLIDGINPLSELYSLVSEGVHGLTEAECIAVADETTSVFEFIFTNLRAQTVTRHDFVEKVKKWAGRVGTKTPNV